jgi:Hypothetical glycosyl hydrolase family 15
MSPWRVGVLTAFALVVALLRYSAAALAPSPALPSRQAPSPTVPSRQAPSPTVPSRQGYPQLANYSGSNVNGLRYAWQVPFFANYGLVIAGRGAPVRLLKRADPHVIALLYERTLQVDLCCARDLYGLRPSEVPSEWWLVSVGSRLAHPITAQQQWITVADPRPFRRCQDVLVDGESMHVWAVSGHMLHVLRGYLSTAAPHQAGTRIAPHYSYRSDLSNCRITGRASSVRPWSFNLSSRCPRWHGQTWANYLAQRMVNLVQRDGWDGIFYDNLSDFPSSPLVDVDRDGRADGGVVNGVNVWRAGERALLAETRRLLPGAPLMVNGNLVIRGRADGREMEGFPLIPGAAVSAAIDAYLDDGAHGAPLTIVNPDSVTRSVPSLPGMQLGVGAALLGAGYVTYDHGWLDHGHPWWFDEYDGGAGSALSQPIAAAAMLLPVVHPRRFQRGDIVLLDLEAARVLRVLDNSLLVQRGIAGTTPAWHPARTVVATPAQRARMRGYLGQPRGPVRLVPTADWAHAVLPLGLVRGPALVDGRAQRLAVQPVSPDTVLEVSSRVHFDPYATRLTLRTLPFGLSFPPVPWARVHPARLPRRALRHGAARTLVLTARGPDGQAFWIDDGHVSVPLVLRSSWHRYVLPISRAGRIVIGLGRIGGRVELRGLQLIGVQAFVLRRDFTHGLVIVNPTDCGQRLPLDRAYRFLAGDQNPGANSGRLTHAVALARYRAAILLNVRRR